ncbi:MAG: 3'(2'),5'-bisphosphate nucleotidase CysQ [Halocynthiibacter sp.]
MPARDLRLLTKAARQSGEIARRHWRATPEVWDKPGGAGPVTEADLEIDRMLQATLCAERPGYGWLSEESEDSAARLSCNRVFIVDPIDGTRAFVNGEPTFAHSLAIATAGKITAAVVYLPIPDKLYTASATGPAELNGVPISNSGAIFDGARVLASKSNLAPGNWGGTDLPVSRHFRPSLAYRMCLVADGAFDAMLSLRDTWEWDVAAGCLIAARAGARVTDANGVAPTFNNPTPKIAGLIAATELVHAGLRQRLTQ